MKKNPEFVKHTGGKRALRWLLPLAAPCCLAVYGCEAGPQPHVDRAAAALLGSASVSDYPTEPEQALRHAAVVHISHSYNTETCTGVLVSPTLVLTAGHCVKGQLGPLPEQAPLPPDFLLPNTRVVVESRHEPSDARTYYAASCVLYDNSLPCFTALTDFALPAGHDLAVLTLTEPVNGARPMPLNLDSNQVYNSLRDAARVVGFGEGPRRTGSFLPGVAVTVEPSDSGGPILTTLSAWGGACNQTDPREMVVALTIATGRFIALLNDETNRNWLLSVLSTDSTHTQFRGEPGPTDTPPDNCVGVPNPDQLDSDRDGLGDACDPCPSIARDPSLPAAQQHGPDSDGDGIPDVCDNAPGLANTCQRDLDLDGVPDLLNAGTFGGDNCPTAANPFQENCNQRIELERTPAGEHPQYVGDACDPVPCTPLLLTSHATDLSECLTGDRLQGECLFGMPTIGIGMAPRAALTGTAGTPPPEPHTTAVRRCVCWDRNELTQVATPVPDEQCRQPSGRCPSNLATPPAPSRGIGWYHLYVDTSATPRVPRGRLFGPAESFGPGWPEPRHEGPVNNYGVASSRADAYSRWQSISGVPSWEVNFLDPLLNPYPDNDSPDNPGYDPAAPNRVLFWARAQRPLEADTSSLVALSDWFSEPTTLRGPHREVRAIDPVLVPWWVTARRFVRFAIPVEASARPAYYEPVSRQLVAVSVLTNASGAAPTSLFANGASADLVRGIALSRVDVHTASTFNAAVTQGAAGELPVAAGMNFAAAPPDPSGWPNLWAFGGTQSGTEQNALYFTTHEGSVTNTLPGSTPTYLWHRVPTVGPGARTNVALAVSADGQRVFLVGGRRGAQLFDDAWVYLVGQQVWQQLALSAPLGARYDAGLAVRGNELWIAGGVGPQSTYLGDLLRIDGITGATQRFGSVLPAGASPSLAFDDRGEELVYGGGYVGSTWYRDVWRVTFGRNLTATSRRVYDFAWSGMPPSPGYEVVADVERGFYWGVPCAAPARGPAPRGVYLITERSGVATALTGSSCRGRREDDDDGEHDEEGARSCQRSGVARSTPPPRSVCRVDPLRPALARTSRR